MAARPLGMMDALAQFRNRIIVASVLDGLRRLPDDSIDCVMTSPPYWGLRDYGIAPSVWDADVPCQHRWGPTIRNPQRDRRAPETKKAQGSCVGENQRAAEFAVANFGQFCTRCGAWRGCLGLEPTIDLFLKHLLVVFDEVQRVLKPTGTCWVNLGDSYAGGWGLRGGTSHGDVTRITAKSLCLVPHRFAAAMAERGWIVRNHIVWYKPNHMPTSVKDRLANTWDHVFLFVKRKRYYFDLDAIRVQHRSWGRVLARHRSSKQQPLDRDAGPDGGSAFHRNGKNPGDCWEIPTRAAACAHYATYPEKLVEIPVRAGCPLRVCTHCGAPRRDVRDRPPNPDAFAMTLRDAQAGKPRLPGKKALPNEQVQAYVDREYTSKGGRLVVAPGCSCKRGFVPGVVLDPFMGSGTTAVVAKRLDRDYVGFEINARYARSARKRLRTDKSR